MRKPVKDYALAVTVSDYVDLRLLDVLRNQFRGKLLLNGRLDVDAYARRQEAVLSAYLVKNKLLLNPVRFGKPGILARFHLPGSREPKIAFARQGRFFWYFSDREFCKANPSDRHVLDTVLVPQR